MSRRTLGVWGGLMAAFGPHTDSEFREMTRTERTSSPKSYGTSKHKKKSKQQRRK